MIPKYLSIYNGKLGYCLTGPATADYPIGIDETFPTLIELVEWLKNTQTYRNEQWVRGSGKDSIYNTFIANDQICVARKAQDQEPVQTRVNGTWTRLRLGLI